MMTFIILSIVFAFHDKILFDSCIEHLHLEWDIRSFAICNRKFHDFVA